MNVLSFIKYMLASQLTDLVTALKVLQAMLTAYCVTITGQYLMK